jgi:diguanylate cyclase (GGDEF)-like protein
MLGKLSPSTTAGGYSWLRFSDTDSNIPQSCFAGNPALRPEKNAVTWRRHDLSRIIEQIPIGVAITLPLGTVEYANSYLHQMLRLEVDQLSGAELGRLKLSGSFTEHQQIRRQLLGGEPWQGETQFRIGAGETLHVLESAYPLHDHEGRIAHFIHFFQDASLFKLSEALKSLAFNDSLTGLPNRNLLNDRLSLAMAKARRTGGGFALLCIDIDHFKQVNDTLGHDAGDELLRKVAMRLQACLRKTDTVARLGGDEFVAILDEVAEPRLATRMVEKLLETCSGDYELQGSRRRVTLSVGVSLYRRDADGAEALLKRADTAMYRAKATGKNRYQLLDSGSARRYGLA